MNQQYRVSGKQLLVMAIAILYTGGTGVLLTMALGTLFETWGAAISGEEVDWLQYGIWVAPAVLWSLVFFSVAVVLSRSVDRVLGQKVHQESEDTWKSTTESPTCSSRH